MIGTELRAKPRAFTDLDRGTCSDDKAQGARGAFGHDAPADPQARAGAELVVSHCEIRARRGVDLDTGVRSLKAAQPPSVDGLDRAQKMRGERLQVLAFRQTAIP